MNSFTCKTTVERGDLKKKANLDLPDGVHLQRVVVQHPQNGLQHPDVVPVLLDELLQLLDPVLLLRVSGVTE